MKPCEPPRASLTFLFLDILRLLNFLNLRRFHKKSSKPHSSRSS